MYIKHLVQYLDLFNIQLIVTVVMMISNSDHGVRHRPLDRL